MNSMSSLFFQLKVRFYFIFFFISTIIPPTVSFIYWFVNNIIKKHFYFILAELQSSVIYILPLKSLIHHAPLKCISMYLTVASYNNAIF